MDAGKERIKLDSLKELYFGKFGHRAHGHHRTDYTEYGVLRIPFSPERIDFPAVSHDTTSKTPSEMGWDLVVVEFKIRIARSTGSAGGPISKTHDHGE